MTLMSWTGATVTVADGDELVEVDCSSLLAALAPIDIVERIDRIEFGVDRQQRRLLLVFVRDDDLRVLSSPAVADEHEIPLYVAGERFLFNDQAFDHDNVAGHARVQLVWRRVES